MWELGILLAGIGIFLYCFTASITTVVNAYSNIQAVDILREIQHVHDEDGPNEGEKRRPYQPD